ncbi:MAG: membrane bound O-acyl transferase family-domain-containing protein [Pirellulaceae bacterium]|nr:membrane bound O-acyl transferase family-domain-containing protein [Pirellulaceae bacterium]
MATITANLRATPSQPHAWSAALPLAILPSIVLAVVPDSWPRWLCMWLLAGSIYAGCKWLTWRTAPPSRAPWRRHLAYLLLWPGMDAAAFLRTAPLAPADRSTRGEWLLATVNLSLGTILVWGVVPAVSRLANPGWRLLLAGWVGMIGIVLILHFGLFHLLSCLWRARGVCARPLMNWPLAAQSISDFWGNRWNTAFRDLTYRHLFGPLQKRFGAAGALLVGFLFSGLVHDLVISLPACGGWGGPTLYFLLQAVAIVAQRSRTGRVLGLGRGRRGWLFTMAVLLGPAFWLFHAPFLRVVVVPFLEALGAGAALN